MYKVLPKRCMARRPLRARGPAGYFEAMQRSLAGLLIAVEGADGAGTTTQCRRLESWLTAAGRVVHLTREPSTGPVGVVIRELLGGAHAPFDPSALALLFAADRLDHLARETRGAGRDVASMEDVEAAARERSLRYDKTGEEHYNLASAFIKSMRGSDPDAALYYALRMIDAGDDPRFVLRRMMIFASEDIGLADSRALELAVAADRAFERLGAPEGLIPLSHAVVYLSLAPKSKSAYNALGAAQGEIQRSGALPVPLRLRNAPTKAMKAWGYGAEYRDPQQADDGFVAERYLPEALGDATFYTPTTRGTEAKIAEHLARLRARARGG